MRSDRKQTIIFVIILLVLSLGIGYAFLTTTLSIEGVSDIDASGWNVHWANLTIDGSSTLPSNQIYTPATISADGKTITYHIKLNEPGDYYVFTVDAVNSGTLDAKIEDISYTINGVQSSDIPNYLATEFHYSNGRVNVGQVLFAGDSINYYYGIGYSTYVDPEDLPSENISLDVSISVTYVQTHIPNTVYAINQDFVTLGQRLPSGFQYYDDYHDFAQDDDDAFLKYELSNDRTVTAVYAGFLYNGEPYYLRGGGATYNNSTNDFNNDSPYYEANQNLLLSIFGSSNCSLMADNNAYLCSDYYNYLTHDYIVRKNGSVYAFTLGHIAEINSNGGAITSIYIPS